MDLSIIVPTLDEELVLGKTLERLFPIGAEIVVSDGGSDDRTREITANCEAAGHAVIWVEGEAGRGTQLNRGAAATSGDVLLFLHADTRLPADAVDRISSAIETGAVGGGFEVRFESDRRIMALGSKLVNLRTRLTRIPLGDQGQFVRRSAFIELGGFRDWPILEDLDFMRRLKSIGEIAVLPASVVTSDRRYAQRGIVRTMLTNYLIWGLYALGVQPERLQRLYQKVR